VESACVHLERRPVPLLPPEQRATFGRLVKRAFSQRRKMMFKLLKEDWPFKALREAFAEVHLSIETRAEAVSLEQFVKLAQTLHTGAGDA
jgi:16S rRNA A1518/A1519 N6-dimethyltransferase RsmA/KsgA/DIM1 with predicted DNA glycosylase/AP lyase activity